MKSSLRRSYGRHHDPLRNIYFTDDHEYVPFVVDRILPPFPLSWLNTGFLTRINTMRVTSGAGTVNLSGATYRIHLRFLLGLRCSICSLLSYVILSTIVCLFVPSLFTIASSCPSIYVFWLPSWYLRFTSSDYPLGILDLRLLIILLVS